MTIELPPWLRGFALLGKYGVDLRAITLDDDGRISAYIYDSVDAWGRTASVGFAELAARLGSPVVYDRSGETHLIETFKHGLQRWTATLSGTDAYARIEADSYLSDGYAVVLNAGSDMDAYAMICWKRSLLPLGKVGLCWSWAIAGNMDWIEVWVTAVSTDATHTAGLQWINANKYTRLWKSTGAWDWFEPFPIPEQNKKAWNTVKMVMDLETAHYDVVRINADEHDASDWVFQTAAGGANPYLQVCIKNVGGWGDEGRHIYVDNIILTLAEE
jgi:hypothetical protein